MDPYKCVLEQGGDDDDPCGDLEGGIDDALQREAEDHG